MWSVNMTWYGTKPLNPTPNHQLDYALQEIEHPIFFQQLDSNRLLCFFFDFDNPFWCDPFCYNSNKWYAIQISTCSYPCSWNLTYSVLYLNHQHLVPNLCLKTYQILSSVLPQQKPYQKHHYNLILFDQHNYLTTLSWPLNYLAIMLMESIL